MRIVHIITTLDRGGAEHHLLQLTTAQVAAAHDVHVVYLKGAGELMDQLRAGGVSCQPVRGGAANLLKEARKANVIHGHLPRAELLAAAMAGRKRPVVVSRHNAEPFWPGVPAAVSKMLCRIVDRRARRVISISQAVAHYFTSTGHTTRTDRLRVVPYGYAASHTTTERPAGATADMLGRPFRLAVIARLAPQKDLPTLLRALRLLADRGHQVDTRIAGAGLDRDTLTRLTGSLNLADAVHFVGRIEQPVEFIAQADAFALPSLYEGFGLVLLEAAAAGVPVVAARNTAMTEVVVERQTGLLFTTSDPVDLADKLEELIAQPALRQQLADAARHRLETVYSVERMVASTLDVYREAMDKARR